MADFYKALAITMGNEGGYNRGVGENETFFGIDRGYHGGWDGWAIVDSIKKANPNLSDKQLNPIFKANPILIAKKDAFYMGNFWLPLQLSLLNDQQCANILFDDNVNPCEINAAHVMQLAVVNCGTPLIIDGQVGSRTIAAVNSINPQNYYNAVIAIRKFHYNNEVVKHPAQRIWLKSWLSRLTPYKLNAA